jgi:hypothetical protein
MYAESELLSLAKQKKSIDLCLAACRKRQSPRTGLIHYFNELEEYTDTIPLYENFCFAIALYRQKTVESVLEGKALLERLLAFQTLDGNFPIFLHEFPRCYDRMQGLKIAPLLLQLQRHFSSVLASELKQKLSLAVENILKSFSEPLQGLWQQRYEMCKYNKSSVEPSIRSAADWADWLVSAQLGGDPPLPFEHLFHPELQVFFDPAFFQIQERFEPRPHLIEWLLAESLGTFSPRLLRDHPLQMQLASLWPTAQLADKSGSEEFVLSENDRVAVWKTSPDKSADVLRFFWGKDPLNSFILSYTVPTHICLIGKNQWEILFDLPEDADQTHNDLFEALFYCSLSPDIHLIINQRQGTVFSLGDQIQISSPTCRISLYFELLSGEGHFRGHISKANRPSQIKTKSYETYDWQIGLRTLRRSPKASIRVVCSIGVYKKCNSSPS